MQHVGRWHIPPRRLVLWYAVSALPLAIVVTLGGFLSYHYHSLSAQGRAQVDRAYEVLEDVAALFVSVEDADLSQRDFIITGSPERLDAFQAALQAIDKREAALHGLLLDDKLQMQRLGGLHAANR